MMDEKVLNEKYEAFYSKFGYGPNIPVWLSGDWFEEYIWALEESVKDGLDYTVELYGTIPSPPRPLAPYCID